MPLTEVFPPIVLIRKYPESVALGLTVATIEKFYNLRVLVGENDEDGQRILVLEQSFVLLLKYMKESLFRL